MRHVTTLVRVFAISCHASEYRNTRPVTPYASVNRKASANTHGDPSAAAAARKNLGNASFISWPRVGEWRGQQERFPSAAGATRVAESREIRLTGH